MAEVAADDEDCLGIIPVLGERGADGLRLAAWRMADEERHELEIVASWISTALSRHALIEHEADVGKMHLERVLILVRTGLHIREEAGTPQLVDG